MRANCAPVKNVITGSPYLFTQFNYPVDPNRAAQLSPAFQAANGPYGANLVAYFGTGNLRSYEIPQGKYRR